MIPPPEDRHVRSYPARHVRPYADSITATLNAGSSSPELVAIEARKAERPAETLLDDEDLAELVDAEPGERAATGQPVSTNVITLPVRNPVLDDNRPLPSVAAYDQLLRLRSSKGTA